MPIVVSGDAARTAAQIHQQIVSLCAQQGRRLQNGTFLSGFAERFRRIAAALQPHSLGKKVVHIDSPLLVSLIYMRQKGGVNTWMYAYRIFWL